MKNLCDAIVNVACFLELSADNVVDPDAAAAALEEVSATLQSATEAEKDAFISACEEEAALLRSTDNSQRSEFISGLPTAMGLQE